MTNPIPLKKLNSAAMITIAAIVILAVGSWYLSGYWYFVFSPIIMLYFIEYGCRIYKLKEYWPPLTRRIIRKVKKVLSRMKPEATTTDHMLAEQPKLLASISEWLLKDMIQCTCYGNYASIGAGTPERVQNALTELLSQYYEASNNEYIKAVVQIKGKIAAIEAQWDLVNTLAAMMFERYSEAGSNLFKKLYPLHEYNCQFTEETFQADWKRVCVGELRHQMMHRQLIEQLDAMEQKNSGGNDLTPEQRHRNLVNKIADIRKVEAVNLDMSTMTVLEFAIYENRLQDHIDNLREQARKYGRDT